MVRHLLPGSGGSEPAWGDIKHGGLLDCAGSCLCQGGRGEGTEWGHTGLCGPRLGVYEDTKLETSQRSAVPDRREGHPHRTGHVMFFYDEHTCVTAIMHYCA